METHDDNPHAVSLSDGADTNADTDADADADADAADVRDATHDLSLIHI